MVFNIQQLWEKSCASVFYFSFYLHINPYSCWSAVDCGIEVAPDRSIIVEGLQQWGDRSLARKHVAQKADKWNLIQIQTRLCCVSQSDRQTISFNLSTCCFWYSNHRYSKYLNVDSAAAEGVRQVKSSGLAVLFHSCFIVECFFTGEKRQRNTTFVCYCAWQCLSNRLYI